MNDRNATGILTEQGPPPVTAMDRPRRERKTLAALDILYVQRCLHRYYYIVL